GPALAADPAQALAAMGDEGVDQCPFRIARCRMDHHAGGLVDHDEIVVLIDDVEIHRLALRLGGRRLRYGEFEDLPWFDPQRRVLYRRSRQPEMSLFDQG